MKILIMSLKRSKKGENEFVGISTYDKIALIPGRLIDNTYRVGEKVIISDYIEKERCYIARKVEKIISWEDRYEFDSSKGILYEIQEISGSSGNKYDFQCIVKIDRTDIAKHVVNLYNEKIKNEHVRFLPLELKEKHVKNERFMKYVPAEYMQSVKEEYEKRFQKFYIEAEKKLQYKRSVEKHLSTIDFTENYFYDIREKLKEFQLSLYKVVEHTTRESAEFCFVTKEGWCFSIPFKDEIVNYIYLDRGLQYAFKIDEDIKFIRDHERHGYTDDDNPFKSYSGKYYSESFLNMLRRKEELKSFVDG